MRANQAAGRAASRQGLLRGDDASLPARDRGPVRKLVRDVVDSRRNVGSFFIAIAVVALIGTVVPNLTVRSYATFLLFGFFLLLVVDSFLLSRRIKRTVAQRFPDGKHKTTGVVWYGISRSTMVRRWRFPKPEVALGADV
jgi:ABC-type multidrug transport system fused ATPase/permease subunit